MIHARTAVVVEDDTDVGDVISSLLDKAGFEVTVARTGADALAVVRDLRPDLVTLDMTLPAMDGVEVCRQIRLVSDCYVIVVSGRTGEVDRLMGLEVGADDYLVKPFSMRELQARVAALFRRPRSAVIDLTRTEFDLLAHLLSNPGVVVPREDLLRAVWATEFVPDSTHVVDVHLANLRRKLRTAAAGNQWIRTIRGVGFRYDPCCA